MGCVTSAQFSLVFNGRGDGFFQPECGLRQGCALSPYLLILGMDLMSRSFKYLVEKGVLSGVQVTPSATPITNCLYADDILVFGAATAQEAYTVVETLNAFASVSGQIIGPEKSSIWFSKATMAQEQEVISQILMVHNRNQGVKYLGAPVGDGRQSFDFLIEKFAAKLKAWQGRLLLHAGRIVLIKAALQSIPVYYMSTAKVPARVLQALTSLIRRFF